MNLQRDGGDTNICLHQDPDLEVQLKGLQVIWWTESMTLSSHPLETPVSDIKGQ